LLQNLPSIARQPAAPFAFLPTTSPPARVHLLSDWIREHHLDWFREWCATRGLLIVEEETFPLLREWVCTDFEVEGRAPEIGELKLMDYPFANCSLNRLLELLGLCGQS
jgi:hypothetical protein